MQLYITGMTSTYETAHLARMFFKDITAIEETRTKSEEYLAVRVSAHRFYCLLEYKGERYFSIEKRVKTHTNKEEEFAVCTVLFNILVKVTGRRPQWGILTGVRPVSIINNLTQAGVSEEDIKDKFENYFLVTPGKTKLALDTSKQQQTIIKNMPKRSCSFYIGIPFCPSRCSYCSFVSRTIGKDGAMVEPYIEKLCEEIKYTAKMIEELNLHLCTIYIGGGTPTAINADMLRKLLGTVKECFDISKLEEYTVEAGRPDCTDFEKLCIIKEYGADRISINPQTLSDEVLTRIGREHTSEDIFRCYEDARRAGHKNINMDLIAGLPGDTVKGFEDSLKGVMALSPENITVHTLTLKRASNLVIDNAIDDYEDVGKMLEKTSQLITGGYKPYYLYRQKSTLQSLENTGFSKAGYENKYNVYIMEELHTILAAGAGGVTKLKNPSNNLIKRIFNYKYPNEYIKDFDIMIKRKEGVREFYASYMDT